MTFSSPAGHTEKVGSARRSAGIHSWQSGTTRGFSGTSHHRATDRTRRSTGAGRCRRSPHRGFSRTSENLASDNEHIASHTSGSSGTRGQGTKGRECVVVHECEMTSQAHYNNNSSYIALHPVKIYKLAVLYIINISIHITSIVNAYIHQHVSFQSAAHLLMPF